MGLKAEIENAVYGFRMLFFTDLIELVFFSKLFGSDSNGVEVTKSHGLILLCVVARRSNNGYTILVKYQITDYHINCTKFL